MGDPLHAKLQTLTRLSDDDRALLDTLLADVRTFAAGADIISEGDRPEFVHLMVSGWSCRFKLLPDGTRQITAFLLPGDFCDAHITLLRQMDHGIGALSPSTVAFIPRGKMIELIDRPAIARALWWASLVDEGVLRAWIVNMGRRDAFRRVAHLFCELHARLRNVGRITSTGFECPATQEDLGDALGLTPVHVNRVLKRLRDQDLVSFRQGVVVIRDLEALHVAADFDPNYLHLAG